MKKLLTLSLLIILSQSLTACYTLAVAGAGAAGGIVAHENIKKD